MKSKFISGVVTGSIIGATASMYAYSKMNPRQRRKLMKHGKKMLFNMVNNMGMF